MAKILYTDLMEYSSDGLAQASWVTDAGGSGGLPSSEYSSDAYTVFLPHCNGTDGSPTFTDSSGGGVGSPHNVTAIADAQIDTAQKKFGTGSGLFDGTGDYLSIPNSADWDFGTGDFTVDFWFRIQTLPSTSDKYVGLVWSHANDRFEIEMYTVDGSNWVMGCYIAGAWISRNITPAEDTWYHFALVRSGSTCAMYWNGTRLGATWENNGNISGSAIMAFGISGYTSVVTNRCLNGWMDEIRISKGIARWTSNFNVLTYDLQCYSEDTIKQQGSYSLKAIATTDAVNDTLTKTLTDYLDYSIMDVLKFEIRASRTGSNIKVKIHDTGGTTSEHTINIASADTWQTESWDISGITGTDRDTIDKIIIEIIDASSDNTIYIDNLFSKAIVANVHTWVG